MFPYLNVSYFYRMTIFCIEQNYFTHKRERDAYTFPEPDIFIKPSTALLSGTEFKYAGFEDNRLYARAELVLRISKKLLRHFKHLIRKSEII